MLRGVGDLIGALGLLLPPWAVAAVLGAILVLAIPPWLDNMRVKQIRGTVRRMVRADDARRVELAEEAMSLAAGRSRRLVAVVEHAAKYDQRALRERALAALEAVDPTAAAHQRRQLAPEPRKTVAHPIETVVNVERLLEQGMEQAARERLDEGLARYPDDPDLAALRQRLG